MNKLLIISGPTATGKTNLAIKIANRFNGVLISADSRQIYTGMDIGTGKDHPKNTKIHLIDIITPNQTFSVAQYQRLVFPLINKIHSQNKLPIIVGGTGQYIDAIINPQKDTFHIKPNLFLRKALNHLPVSFLQFILLIINPSLYLSLNNSDKNNPHRLIRKIEISLSPKFTPALNSPTFDNYLHLSLTAPNSIIYSRINTRVQRRLDLGLLGEIKKLLKKYTWNSPGLNTLSYKEFRSYFDQNTSMTDVITKWTYDEHACARRQKTWFKKMPKTKFIDISQKNLQTIVMNHVSEFLTI